MCHDNDLSFIFSRRSIRRYLSKPVPEEMIQEMLKAAMAAPSAKGLDPWRFVAIQDPTVLAALSQGLPNGPMLATAPLGIAVCGDIGKANDSLLSYLLQDCSAAIENLLLAAHVLGLGACWLGVHPREDRMQHVAKTLQLPDEIIPVCCIAVGYPAEEKPARTRFKAEYVHYEKW